MDALSTLRAHAGPRKGASFAREQVDELRQTADVAARRKCAELALRIGHYDDEGRAVWREYLAAGCPGVELTVVVVDSVTCPNCGAPEVANGDAPVAEWRFNIRAFRVDDWSECVKCGCWFDLAGNIEAPPKERHH